MLSRMPLYVLEKTLLLTALLSMNYMLVYNSFNLHIIDYEGREM